MNRSTLHQIDIIKQDAMVGINMKKGFSLTSLLHNLIREYGTYQDNNLSVDVDNFELIDKRLLISHFESAEWYAYACESYEKTQALWDEHRNHIQKLINDDCYEVYKDVMEEMRDYR